MRTRELGSWGYLLLAVLLFGCAYLTAPASCGL